MARSLGADEVIDYTRQDFTRGGQRYDLILDVAANRPLSDCRRVLLPTGVLVIVGAADGRHTAPIVARLVAAVAMSCFSSQRMLPFLARNSKEDLIFLSELIEAGKVTPVIDRTYPLSETAAAIRYLEGGHARAKVVITL